MNTGGSRYAQQPPADPGNAGSERPLIDVVQSGRVVTRAVTWHPASNVSL